MKLYFGKRVPVVISKFYSEWERRIGVRFGRVFIGVVWVRSSGKVWPVAACSN